MNSTFERNGSSFSNCLPVFHVLIKNFCSFDSQLTMTFVSISGHGIHLSVKRTVTWKVFFYDCKRWMKNGDVSTWFLCLSFCDTHFLNLKFKLAIEMRIKKAQFICHFRKIMNLTFLWFEVKFQWYNFQVEVGVFQR